MTFIQRFKANPHYVAPENSLILTAIDMHTGGEPLRVITDGYPEIAADSLLAYRRTLKQEFDYLRTSLMYEPRGHADMYGCLVLPPFNEEADCSVIFMHNEGYSTMCGHAVIGIMTLAMEMGWVDVIDGQANMVIEAPCGLIKASGQSVDGKISASFECVPSFVAALNDKVFINSLGQYISYDLAYGGGFYAYVDARQMDLGLTPENHHQLIELGREIKQAVAATSNKIKHPYEYDLSFLYGTIFVGAALSGDAHSRNVCIFADGEVDRSPTGSGVSGRMALHHAKGEIGIGESIKIESILGTTFDVEVASTLTYCHYDAVIPKVTGNAYVCGENRFVLRQDDPLCHGFLLR